MATVREWHSGSLVGIVAIERAKLTMLLRCDWGIRARCVAAARSIHLGSLPSLGTLMKHQLAYRAWCTTSDPDSLIVNGSLWRDPAHWLSTTPVRWN